MIDVAWKIALTAWLAATSIMAGTAMILIGIWTEIPQKPALIAKATQIIQDNPLVFVGYLIATAFVFITMTILIWKANSND